MRVYDCTMLFNELDLLELRFATLGAHVDVFVVAEADRTHAGAPKPWHWERARREPRFAPWLAKVRHVKVGLPEKVPTGTCAPWCAATEAEELAYRFRNEHAQRFGIYRGLHDAAPDDLVLLSDLDEIPNPEAVAARAIGAYAMPTYYYRLNWLTPDRIVGTIAFPKLEMETRTLQWLREHRYHVSPVVNPGGWHFSYLGDADRVRRKIEAAGHAEVDKAHVKDGVEAAIGARRDLLGRWPGAFDVRPLAEMPPVVRADPARWAGALDLCRPDNG